MKIRNSIFFIALLLLASCSPGTDYSKWPEDEMTDRMERCLEELRMKMTIAKAKETCSCMLLKTMGKYPDPADAVKMDLKTLEAFTEECSEY